MAVDWKKLIGLRGVGGKDEKGSTGLGPDFPESAGDRERGKFRESGYPRLTTIAVSNDDGSEVGSSASASSSSELALEIRKLRLALMRTGFAADIDGDNFDDIS